MTVVPPLEAVYKSTNIFDVHVIMAPSPFVDNDNFVRVAVYAN